MPRPDSDLAPRILGVPRWVVVLVPIVAILVGAAFSVTPLSSDKPAGAGAFNAKTFAAAQYSKTVVPYIAKHAQDLGPLLTELAADQSGTEKKFGHNSGAGSGFAFPVSTTATAGAVSNGLVPLTVTGAPSNYTVFLQVGPAINGSALRDVSGTIGFGNFQNQIDYQNAALALNDQAKTMVLKALDPSSLNGKTLNIEGAFVEGANAAFIGIVPTKVTAQ